ncbi:Sialic acid TRAP transporter permease protein SiaT [Oceanibacterium hippocampi]|uniref:TRAP transporter large permease protein n=2 Tax=Oceanibacterium hippocampi TaxID=745714 RepID=A0A1Y5TLF0_9PROT|nr:Sialic acid TRAP transporter permease protein SiaT [Oceanibacterium hippocampi]
MDPIVLGLGCLGGLIAMLVIGVPVAVAMGLTGIAGMWLGFGEAFTFGQLRSLPFAITGNYGYAVLPLFILMGVFAQRSGITTQLFHAADLWLRRLRGSMYLAVICASGVFAAVSGSTVVNSVVFTRLAFPEMLRLGYSKRLSVGSIAASGTFAAMIPPSIVMVVYAIVAEQSVGQLFLAGVFPGLLSIAAFSFGTLVLVRLRPELAPQLGEQVPFREKIQAAKGVWGVLLLVVIVLGGIYAGFFAPSAAGAVGAFGAAGIALWRFRGRLTGWFGQSLAEAASVSCIIFAILIGGLIFSRFIVVTGMVDYIGSSIIAMEIGPIGFIIIVSILYIILGMVVDTVSMMLLTLPFLMPIAIHLDINLIWFGIVIIKLAEISAITPPIGMNLFAVMSSTGGKVGYTDIVRGVIPFIVLELMILFAIIYFPVLSTWLPSKMF